LLFFREFLFRLAIETGRRSIEVVRLRLTETFGGGKISVGIIVKINFIFSKFLLTGIIFIVQKPCAGKI